MPSDLWICNSINCTYKSSYSRSLTFQETKYKGLYVLLTLQDICQPGGCPLLAASFAVLKESVASLNLYNASMLSPALTWFTFSVLNGEVNVRGYFILITINHIFFCVVCSITYTRKPPLPLSSRK